MVVKYSSKQWVNTPRCALFFGIISLKTIRVGNCSIYVAVYGRAWCTRVRTSV